MTCRAMTVAVIPARYRASRFPGKLLRQIHGRSIIRHVHERAREVRGIQRVVVAVDDPRLLREVESFGGEAVLTSGEHPSGTDRIGEAVSAMRPRPDFVINLQGDEPLLSPRAVELLLASLHSRPDSIWTLADRIRDEEEWRRVSVVKVVCAVDGRALFFSREPIPHRRDHAGVEPLRHVGVYGYPREMLERFLAEPPSPLEKTEGLEQLRALEIGMTIRVERASWPGWGIDTPEDLERLLRCHPTAAAFDAAGRDRVAEACGSALRKGTSVDQER